MPTIRRCCIVGCQSNSRQDPQMQFFQFPKPENPFHKLWKQACEASLSRILPFKKPVLCALHFHSTSIGGRRLTATAVPSLRLEVPSNLKAVEQQAMMEEIERSRKCAYINAVVYEWLVRANLNPQLRGSITHGMIKQKAEAAMQIIGTAAFQANNRWLNRFRETHLAGFAQKLAMNQLKPLGPSLWIPDVVQDLQHLFPPTNAERMTDFGSMPEQYIDYMRQYGEFEEDDDLDQSYQDQGDQSVPHDSQQNISLDQQNRDSNSPQSLSNSTKTNISQNQIQTKRSASQSPLSQPRSSPSLLTAKKQKIQESDDDVKSRSSDKVGHIEDLTDGPNDEINEDSSRNYNNNYTMNGMNGVHKEKTSSVSASSNGYSSASVSPKPMTNGYSENESPLTLPAKVVETYAQAIEYLKPLEDFALFNEHFRAIGLITQLEMVLRKGKPSPPDFEE